MPWFPHALIDVLAKYVDWLVTIRKLRVGAILGSTQPLTHAEFVRMMTTKEPDGDTLLTNGWRSIEQIRRIAKLIVDDELMRAVDRVPLTRPEKGLALRIRRNCDQLKAIVTRFRSARAWQPYLLSARGQKNPDQAGSDTAADDKWDSFRDVDDGLTRGEISKALEKMSSVDAHKTVLDVDTATRLRKIWELGTDEIVAQTLVHIDGDTITRFQRDIPDEERMYYLSIHNQGVTMAVQQWKTLFDAFTELLGGLAARLFGRAT